MTVINLTASKHVKGRYYVEFESGETLKVTDILVGEYGLSPERELTDDEFSELRENALESGAKSRALRILGAKMCSRGELRQRLIQLGERDDTADDVCEWCVEMGLLDDREYARYIVEGYAARGYGSRKIRDELYRRRIPREYWDELFIDSGDTAAERAMEFIENKLRGEAPDRDDKKKISASLIRRGFSWDEINAAFLMYGERSFENELL